MTIEALSIKYFGSPHYRSQLDILAPYSAPVKGFLAEVKRSGLNLDEKSSIIIEETDK